MKNLFSSIYMLALGLVALSMNSCALDKKAEPVKDVILRTAKIDGSQAVGVYRIRGDEAVSVAFDGPFRGVFGIFGAIETQAEIVERTACPEHRRTHYMI